MTSDVAVRAPSLQLLDELAADDLALGLFTDERPLRGMAGLLDWRLCGMVSRFLMEQRFCGAAGEQVLMPGHGRVAPQRLFFFGLGPRRSYGAQLEGLGVRLPAVLRAAACGRVAIALPAPSKTAAACLKQCQVALDDHCRLLVDPDGKLAEWL